jgi:hypothetical protein
LTKCFQHKIANFIIDLTPEYRKSKRFDHKANAMITSEDGYYYYVTMRNYSHGGMSLESLYPIQSGATVEIELDKPIFENAPKACRGNVVWCQQLDLEDEPGAFGIGVEFL